MTLKKNLTDWQQCDFCDPGFRYMPNSCISNTTEDNKNEECEG
jgi:hypothetical protein